VSRLSRAVRLASRAVTAGALVLAALGGVAGCSDSSTAPGRRAGPHGQAGPAIVSDPVARSGGVTGLAAASPLALAAEGAAAYVSLPPGSVPGGTTADNRNVATGASLTVAMADGGFDPVEIAASVGDELAVEVRGQAGVLSRLTVKVPDRRPPAVVRTSPPKGKPDVALNSRVLIVFSEPMDAATLAAAVQLRAGEATVAGSVRVDADGLTAEFVPEAPLAPTTEYELVVTTAVRDLGGDALEAPVTTQFTTRAAEAPETARPLVAFARDSD